jgi:hypothetical protein
LRENGRIMAPRVHLRQFLYFSPVLFVGRLVRNIPPRNGPWSTNTFQRFAVVYEQTDSSNGAMSSDTPSVTLLLGCISTRLRTQETCFLVKCCYYCSAIVLRFAVWGYWVRSQHCGLGDISTALFVRPALAKRCWIRGKDSHCC